MAMGDDPYDFEIALPAAPRNGDKAIRERHGSDDTNDDASEGSVSLGNMSGISSEDSDRGGGHERQRQTEATLKGPSKSLNEPKTATPSSGSALDRAKTFLAKYSSATTSDSHAPKAVTSSGSRRISLDLDDDDFSLSSGDESEHSDSTSPDVTTKITSADQAKDASLPHRSLASDSGVYNDDAFEEEEPVVVEIAKREPAYSSTVIASGNLEYSMEFSESEPDEHPQLKLSALQTDLHVDQYKVSSSSIVSSQVQDEVASSLDSTSEDEKKETSSMNDEAIAPKLSNNVLLRSAASENGMYDEDAFEEDESIPNTSTGPTIVVSQTIAKPEVGYSMDLSEDASEQTETTVFRQALRMVPLVKDFDSRSISGKSEHGGVNGEQSALLESGSSEGIAHSCIADDTAGSRTHGVGSRSSSASEPEVGKSIPEVQYRAVALLERETISGTEEGLTPAQGCSSFPVHADYASSLPKPDLVERPHVTIVREFELCEAKRMEMKDASTQFTGNHAAIQANLIPDGMHNLFEPGPATMASQSFFPAQPRDDKSIPCQTDQQLPPPPISPLLGSSTYNMNEIRLPMATSTSIYKQQLLALQEQILQKKRETERIVHDRMTFQYSSLRGTERFIAARQTQKMELWEALMRVDPTLDEQKARKVAQLAQSNL